MHDIEQLHAFMADIANQQITIQASEIILSWAGRTFKVASTSPQRSGIELFEALRYEFSNLLSFFCRVDNKNPLPAPLQDKYLIIPNFNT